MVLIKHVALVTPATCASCGEPTGTDCVLIQFTYSAQSIIICHRCFGELRLQVGQADGG